MNRQSIGGMLTGEVPSGLHFRLATFLVAIIPAVGASVAILYFAVNGTPTTAAQAADVTLVFSPRPNERTVMWLSILAAMAGAAVCYLAVHRLVLLPLRQITNLRVNSAGNASYEDLLPATIRYSELGDVARRLDALMAERESTRKECQSCDENFSRLLESAQSANLAKAQFVSTLSHELRTPLNAIIGFSQIIRDETPDKGAQALHGDFAQEIYNSGVHLLDLINEMLDLANLESGPPPKCEVIDVHHLIAATVRGVEGQVEAQGLRLTTVVAPEAQSLWADSRMTGVMLGHILSNAVKFTPPGGTITVSAARSGDDIRLTVTDTGIGIAADDLPQIFQPFWQAAPVMSRQYDGVGLGLTLVRSMCERQKGRIDISSEAGRGTTITVALPSPLAATRVAEVVAAQR